MSTKRTIGPENLTANGATGAIEIGDSGRVYMSATGTFGTGSLALQTSRADGNFADSSVITALTAAGEGSGVLAPGVVVRANLSGATSPDINVQIITG